MRPPGVTPEPTGPGEESVWDYPRPPRLEPLEARVVVELGGRTVIDTLGALRMLETSHPPSIYLPLAELAEARLDPAGGGSFCEWKGIASYFDVVAGDARASRAAWAYPEPTASYAAIATHFSLYPALVDACWVDGARVTPQPGRFYGGWITPGIRGPFKGEPGTDFW